MIKIVEYRNVFPPMIDIIVDDLSIAQIDFCEIDGDDGHITLYNDDKQEFSSLIYDEWEVIK